MRQAITIMVCGMIAVACSATPIERSGDSDVQATPSANIHPEEASSGAMSPASAMQPACGPICTSHTISFNSSGWGPDCATAYAAAATNAQPEEQSTCIAQGFIGACLASYVDKACFFGNQANAWYAVVTATAHCSDTNC